jgi:flagellar biosynthesis protein FlhB
MADEEKNLDPTPKRREDFRKRGQFARARDLGAIAATSAVLAAIVGGAAAARTALAALIQATHGDLLALRRGSGELVARTFGGALFAIAGPAAVAAAVAATAASLAQSGGQFDVDQLELKPERLNPLPRLQGLFSPINGGKEALMAVLRVGIVGYVGYRVLVSELPLLLSLGRQELPTGAGTAASVAVRVVLLLLLALGLVAAADYAQSWLSTEKAMKMSRKEIEDEMRSDEGDMKAKGRMRAKARRLSRQRSLEGVKQASVVVTNPTHIAVALRYSGKDPAPIVVAKGHDDFAMEIRARARKFGVPIVENRPLARALDREVQLGRPIPGHHFAAVARVLAYVFRLKRRA